MPKTRKKHPGSAAPAASTVTFSIQPMDSTQVPLLLSNHATVVHTQNEFILSFYQVHPPPGLPGPGQQVQTTLPAVCIAHIVLTPAYMEQFATQVFGQLQQFKAGVVAKATQS